MITPDTKDWTWVLSKSCPECGFSASSITSAEVAEAVRSNIATWRRLGAGGGITSTRTDPDLWSPLEYACHVRDVFVRYDERLARMANEANPLFQNWDQDATAIADRYREQDPSTVVDSLVAAGGVIADRLDSFSDEDWSRPGRRSDDASFTIDSISRYMLHDVVHHVWDVERER